MKISKVTDYAALRYCLSVQKFPHGQGRQSHNTHVVILHDLFTFCARFKVCLTVIVLNPTVYSYGFLFNCTTVGQASDSMTALA